MTARYHGYRYPAPDCAGRFHFGTLAFFQTIEHQHVWRIKGDEKPPDWPERWFDRKFRQACTKFSDTLHKLYTVAHLIDVERRNIIEYQDKRELEQYAKHLHGRRTVPIYLDSLLFYLRILADTIADLTPYLYPESDGKQVACRSFRDQRKWFMGNEQFDVDYTRVLTDYSDP